MICCVFSPNKYPRLMSALRQTLKNICIIYNLDSQMFSERVGVGFFVVVGVCFVFAETSYS